MVSAAPESYDIHQRESQEEGSRMAEKLPTRLDVSWLGLKEGTRVCPTGMRDSGGLCGTFTTHQAETGADTSCDVT